MTAAADADAVRPRFSLLPLSAADLPVIVPLNTAAVPHVNDLDPAAMQALLDEAALAVKAVDEAGAMAGFVIVFGPGASYASENYRWFCANMDDFLYVDRIVVDQTRRRSGAARALYEHVFAVAAERGVARVTCEVNLRPANPVSVAFHTALGFTSVGELEPYGGAKRVTLLARPTDGAGG
ncbi:GNAT family N-acetyltransferase [Caenispirillum bisanense]|uniref:GNAT family N-acetyltransferase n=1 Tax=Caenispirillum bisanense TaxID=414052 RepID=UPI0031D74B09